MISGRKSPFYIVSELFAGLFAISFFLFHYDVIPYPETLSTIVFMLLFILFQEAWVNRELYSFIELETIPKEEKKYVVGFMFLFIILLLAPLFWVILSVFRHYLINPL